MTYRGVDQLQREAGGLAPSCELRGVSRSGDDASRQRLQPPRQIAAVETQVVATFMASGRSYGSRRVRAARAVQGTLAGRYRVRTIMREPGLRPGWRRPFVHTTDSQHDVPVAPKVLNSSVRPGRDP
jgi:putative transposase